MDAECEHPVRLHGLCAICGVDVPNLDDINDISIEDESTAPKPILHNVLGLTVSLKEAERVEKDLQKRLLSFGKLSLVVDLDQTVLHATIDPAVNSLLSSRPDIHRVTLPELPDQIYYIKLRPHLEEFLLKMSKLFELHVYTMGSRSYARAVMGIIDPQSELFYDRILTRDDTVQSGGIIRKSLKRIFPADDSTVLVIDDRADIWDYSRNLIPVPPYTFFVGVGDINRPGVDTKFLADDATNGVEDKTYSVITNDDDSELLLIERILTSVHSQFLKIYNNSNVIPDVKLIVDEQRRSVLLGASIVFSGIIPLGLPPHQFELWKLAVMFGAECHTTIRSSTTHLISFRNDTDKVIQAVEAGIRVVRPEWLIESFKKWEMAPIDNYLVQGLPGTKKFPKIVIEELLESQTEEIHLDPLEFLAMKEEIEDELGGITSESDDTSSDQEGHQHPQYPTPKRPKKLIEEASVDDGSDSFSDDSLLRSIEDDLL